MLFRQLFDRESSTYTYLLADAVSRDAVLIDPVVGQTDRDMRLISELGLHLKYTLDTHIHADHVTGAGVVCGSLGAQCCVSAAAGVEGVDVALTHGMELTFGRHVLEARSTPGHTAGCMTFVVRDGPQTYAFTGDALLVRGCGRTDFQQGSAPQLYTSVHSQIFSLGDDTLVYPGHDYRGRTMTTVREERGFNPRLRDGISQAQFTDIMHNLRLANPRLMDVAVPANLSAGLTGGPPTGLGSAPYSEIPPQAVELADFRIIDVREPAEFDGELGHLPGAELVPFGTFPGAATDWDPTRPLLLVCRTGRRSGLIAGLLAEIGFHNVTNLAGGMFLWREQEQPDS